MNITDKHEEFITSHYDELINHFVKIHKEEYQQYCLEESDGVSNAEIKQDFASTHPKFHDFIEYEFKNWIDNKI